MQILRETFQIHRIEGPHQSGTEDQQITPVEIQLNQRTEIAADHDQSYTGERQQDACPLSGFQRFLVDQQGTEGDQDRSAGIDQYRVDRRGSLDGQVDQRVKSGNPQQPLNDDIFAFPDNDIALMPAGSPGES